jgi:hypothetical protein
MMSASLPSVEAYEISRLDPATLQAKMGSKIELKQPMRGERDESRGWGFLFAAVFGLGFSVPVHAQEMFCQGFEQRGFMGMRR